MDKVQPTRLIDYKTSDFLIPKTHLEFFLHPTQTKVTATLKVLPLKTGVPLVLDGEDLVLLSLKISGQYEVNYEVTPTQLIIHNPPAKGFTLTIRTQINPEANTSLSGLYRSNGTFCTQCEAEGFRRITYFLDRPDVLSVYTVRIEAPLNLAPLLLSNGNSTAKGVIGNWHYSEWHDPHPKPSYLFALVGGDLALVKDEFRTMNGRNVALEIYVEHGKEARATYAMDALKRSFKWDEEAFGREYDLNVFMLVAVSDFNMGAMENKGLNIFNDKYVLADPATATDADYANIEGIIAHEYFHNWTGNRITCRDWFQLSLKEGLTVFRDQEFSADMRSRPVKRIKDVRVLKGWQFAEDAGPLQHAVRPKEYMQINNFYTATIYNKGAEVIRMMKTLIGEVNFAKGLDLYFTRHDGQATTIELYVKCFEEVTGKDLSQFCLWYEQSGTPEVSVQTQFETGVFTLNLSQKLNAKDKKAQVIPFKMALIAENGKEILNDVLVLDEFEKSFTFKDLTKKPHLSLNREFSAAVNINYSQSDEELIFLSENDSDDYNRWQAVQSLALNTMKRLVAGDTIDETPFYALIKKLIADAPRDPAFFATALSLPSEQELAQSIKMNIDPTLIHVTHKGFYKRIAKACEAQFSALYHAMQLSEPYSPAAKQAGKRSLRNIALAYLALAGQEQICASHFEKATNMTDKMSGLTNIYHYGSQELRAKAAINFENEFAQEPLVLNNWFMIQAGKQSEEAVTIARNLLSSPAFEQFNPNRIRSLIGGFTANQAQFNAENGKGYEFIAEQLLLIDKVNPQTAASIANAFRSYQSLEPIRQALALKTLKGLLEHDLSSNLKDMVMRMVG